MKTDGLHLGQAEAAQQAAQRSAAEIVAIDSAIRAAELERGDEFASALRQCTPLLWAAGLFSGAVNLLFLAAPIYLIQVYGRVIPSGSGETLVALSLALLLALGLMTMFDTVRGRILVRAAARLDRAGAPRLQRIIDLAPQDGAVFRNAQALRDLDQFRNALVGTRAVSFSICLGCRSS